MSSSVAAPVWDWPTRVFHWLIVLLFAFLWWSGENGPQEWHMRAGYAMLAALLFRLLWGVIGSSTARFTGFVRGPRAVFAYITGRGHWSGVGHSPLGALSVIAMLGLLAVQVTLGLVLIDEDGLAGGPLSHLVGLETSETALELHQLLFNLLLALVALHVAAIAFYRLVLGRRLVGPMIRGSAPIPAEGRAMVAAPAGRALLCALAAAAATGWVIAGAPPFKG